MGRFEMTIIAVLFLLSMSVVGGAKGSNGDEGGVAGIMVTASEAGLNYAKQVLIRELQEVKASPMLLLPDVSTHVEGAIGRVDAQMSHIELSRVNVSYSEIELASTGAVTVFAGDVRASVRFHWAYQYSAALFLSPVNDSGWADVQVKGMQAAVMFTLTTHNGTLRLEVLECGAHIDDLKIESQGGVLPWLYQFLVNAFEEQIRTAIEPIISKQIEASAEKLDTFLQALPRFLPIDDVSTIDVTIVDNPMVSSSFLSVGVHGEFSPRFGKSLTNFTFPEYGLQPGLSCSDSSKMVTIALCDYVINSAAAVYYEAGLLEWRIDEAPKEAWLNTHFWRILIPHLYKKYPNMDMALDFGCSKAPSIQLEKDGVTTNAAADLILLVKSDGEELPVACISLALSMDAVVNVAANNITAEVSLDELKLELKWSEVGKFPVALLQPTLRTIISRMILPVLNSKLKKGFPLPMLPTVDLKNADIKYEDGFIFICSDVYYKGVISPRLAPKR